MTRETLLLLRDALARAWAPTLTEAVARERASNAIQPLAYGVPERGLAAHLRTTLEAARRPEYGGAVISDAQIEALTLAGCAALAEALVAALGSSSADLLEAILSVPGMR